MAEQDRGSDDPQLAAIARHALHDEELIVAFAAGDVEDRADAERARALVERCAKCHELQRDVSAIRAAMQVSGTAAQRAQTRRAPRDFRLTAEDAARLRPGSPVTRLAVRLGWRDRVNLGLAAFGRPVGAAITTFGVVGLLVGTLTLGGGSLGAMSGAAAPSTPSEVDQTASAPESTRDLASYVPLATAKEETPGSGGTSGSSGGLSGPGVLLAGSLTLIVVGVGLIVAARRNVATISASTGN